MSQLATRETTATSRSRSNGGCEIQRAKNQGTVTQRVELPEGELNGPWGMTLPSPPALRLKVYSGCYPNRPRGSDRGAVEGPRLLERSPLSSRSILARARRGTILRGARTRDTLRYEPRTMVAWGTLFVPPRVLARSMLLSVTGRRSGPVVRGEKLPNS